MDIQKLLAKATIQCSINGVVLNKGEFTNEEIKFLDYEGYLVLTDGEEIEYEDPDTGELLYGIVTIKHPDFFLFDEYNCGKIVREWEISFESYIWQLYVCGALDAYPKVEV